MLKESGQHQIAFTLNGQPAVARNLPPTATLLDFVRSQGLTGSKEGCAEGECGACTVLMVQPAPNGGSQFVPFNSCLMLLPMAAGQEIYTVESLARDGCLSESQQAMVDQAGSQCGYCTPGFVVSLFAEQYRPGRTTPCDPHALSGNLCRCTGYRPIRDAALALGPAPSGPFLDRLQDPAPCLEPVAYLHKSAQFYRPTSLAECQNLVAMHKDAQFIAGATDLAVESNLRDRRWPTLISVEAIPELRQFHDFPDAITIGAALTLTEIGERWSPPFLKEWLNLFASPLIRNRATLGGNLATASPISDGAPLLLALDAVVQTAQSCTIPLGSFYRSYRQTALTPGDLILSIEIPKPIRLETRFYKVAKRRTDDISTVCAAIAVTLDASSHIARARFAYGGVAATPIRALEAEQAVLGRPWNSATIQLAQQTLARTLKPMTDHRGSAEYRLAMAQSLLEKYADEHLEAAA
jgi:xanthine dehydrogenase small subunit